MDKALEIRYQRAMKSIGGAEGLLRLPEQVRQVLKDTTDLDAKTRMLEAIAIAVGK